MKRNSEPRKPPPPSVTRSDRDWVMFALGIGLIVLFVVIGYGAMTGWEGRSPGKIRGPVKDPAKVGSIREEGQFIRGRELPFKNKTLQTGLQGHPCRFLKGFAQANAQV
ncbi:MAG: hypothetical protein AB1733_03725 [Thermodesulfobacteriota bacterium]